MKNRPAETGGVAGALGLLIGYIAGIDDPALIVALGVVIGFIPAAITWVVEQARRGRGEVGMSAVEAVLVCFLAVLAVYVLLRIA